MHQNRLFFLNDFFFAVLLAAPLFHSSIRYFANTYLCAVIILILILLNYRTHKAVVGLASAECGSFMYGSGWKLKARMLAWAAFVPTVMLVGAGPITDQTAYAVDKFSRVIGQGIVNNYFVTKKVHYFYFALIIYGLLVYGLYQNICLSLMNNVSSKIRRLREFSDTLLFVGYSFLLVCIYRQFSAQYSHDLTAYILKSVLLFMFPAFYLWQKGGLKVLDIRLMLALALFSFVLSVDIVVFFDARNFKFYEILAAALFVSLTLFLVNKKFSIFNDRVLLSNIVYISIAGALSLVLFSVLLECVNIIALKSDKFIDMEKTGLVVFFILCVVGCLISLKKKQSCKKTTSIALFLFVLGTALIQFQPALLIGADMEIYESANYAVPISDFFNFGKIPLIENFPGHGILGVISSLLYGAITSDYKGAMFLPWYTWLYQAACALILYLFIKRISNGLVAVSSALILPYLGSYTSYYCIGLIVILPFVLYVQTLKKRYLTLTVIAAIFIAAYRLDLGFTFVSSVICSSFFVTVFSQKKIVKNTLLYFAISGAAVFILFVLISLVKDISPISRIREYLSIASSNDHWGLNSLGDSEKNSYSLFYFVLPAISVLCLMVSLVCRFKFSAAQFSVLICLLFAYYANLPRLLVRHSLAEYSIFLLSLWLWTLPIALSFLIALLFSRKSLFIFCQTVLILSFYIFFQGNTYYDNSPLAYAASRGDWLSGQLSSDSRKGDIGTVFSRGSRVIYNENGSDGFIRSREIRTIVDLLLAPDETYLDFTNQSTSYALSGRRNPSYAVQAPSMLSGEISQREFIKEIESDINKVPVAIMPTNADWYLSLRLDGLNNNIRHYLVAEWIYKNYRPFIKYNDFASIWVLNSRYGEFYQKLNNPDFPKSKYPLIDWGYDNFVSLPEGVSPKTENISAAHDYNVGFLPYVWGQFDVRHASRNEDLVHVAVNDSFYAWQYRGKENKPAYIRLDLSADKKFVRESDSVYLIIGNMEKGNFIPLNRYTFKVKKGKNAYLFRISADYNWSQGKLNTLVLDPRCNVLSPSVRVLEGD